MPSAFERRKGRPPQMAPEPYSFLPRPISVLIDPIDPPKEGWWIDPLSSDSSYQRYYDGKRWTHYIRARCLKSWTQVFEDLVSTEVDPDAAGIPRPPAVPEPPPEPPTAGWWEDPIERLKQARYFDGTQWTDLIAPTKLAGPRLVVRRRDPKEVLKEQKAARAAAKAQKSGGAPAKRRRWPWSHA